MHSISRQALDGKVEIMLAFRVVSKYLIAIKSYKHPFIGIYFNIGYIDINYMNFDGTMYSMNSDNRYNEELHC